MGEELNKITAVSAESQTIGEFLEWAQTSKQLVIASWVEEDLEGDALLQPKLVPAQFTIEKILAEYFEIDLKKAEVERRAMLATIRRK